MRVMAAVNVSPESFYKGSVVTSPTAIAETVRAATQAGADIIDIGAMSSAPYLSNEISEEAEKERIRSALKAIAGQNVVVSVDTMRSSVAELALRDGASVVNDVSGLKNDGRMAKVVRDSGASLLAMAHSSRIGRGTPVAQVRMALSDTLAIAEKAEIRQEKIVLDPGIGFFREEGAGRAYSPQRLMQWKDWDVAILRRLPDLERLGSPLCVGLSRKSFIGKILGLADAGDRLPGSLSATAIAVLKGVDMVRTHDVKETFQAIRVAEAVIGRDQRESPGA